MYLSLFKREMTLQFSSPGDVLAVPSVYILVVSFYVMSQPHGELHTLAMHGVLWVAALMALGLTQYRIYEKDMEDGTLEQWGMLPVPLEGAVVIKCLSHWITSGLPLVILSPLIFMMLGSSEPFETAPLLALGLGTLSLTALGSVAGALSLRFASRQLITLLLVFPLAVPVVIFGAAAMVPGSDGVILLISYTLAVLPLSIMVSAILLRYVMRY